ncbi:MAG: hypothetical protein F6K16_37445, partial [Symploca sp. SIO2B6]|nr:hypothetical protein [Symploca sp. SIO2B6]
FWLNQSSLPPAPTPPQTPSEYPVLLPGQERKRQTRLGLWDRFQTADGWLPSLARFLVATTVIVSVLWAGTAVGNPNLDSSQKSALTLNRANHWTLDTDKGHSHHHSVI